MNYDILFKILFIIGALAIGIGSRFIPGFKNDNVVEEAAEQVIKQETGLDIDLTPQSPEQ